MVTDECIDNCIFLDDHYQYALNPNVQLSCDHPENEIVTLNDQELLTKGQERHILLSKEEFLHGQLFSLDQYVLDHGFVDPIATLLDSYHSDFLKILDFIISPEFLGEFLSMLLYLCYFYCLVADMRLFRS